MTSPASLHPSLDFRGFEAETHASPGFKTPEDDGEVQTPVPPHGQGPDARYCVQKKMSMPKGNLTSEEMNSKDPLTTFLGIESANEAAPQTRIWPTQAQSRPVMSR